MIMCRSKNHNEAEYLTCEQNNPERDATHGTTEMPEDQPATKRNGRHKSGINQQNASLRANPVFIQENLARKSHGRRGRQRRK